MMSEEITVDVDPLGLIGQMNTEAKNNLEMQTAQKPGKRCKKPRKNGILNRQARMIIYNVNRYLKKESEEGIKNIKQVEKRTAEATDTSVNTVRRIVKEGSSILKKGSELMTEFKTPGKKRPRAKHMTEVSTFDQGVIKRCIHNFHITEKVLPSIIKLRLKLANDIKYQGSDRSLSRIVKRLGFRWKRTENNKKLLIEKSDIRFKRIEYLQKLRKYRQEGRNIVYTGETSIDVCNYPPKTINDAPKKPVAKGQRIVIVHAGSEAGFIPNALFMFKASPKTGDNNEIMSYENYKRWLRTQLLPNLPNNSIVVVDNASYHNKQYDPAPTSNAKMIDMQAWLTQRRIYYTEDMLKPQLYNLIKCYKKQDKIYSIDKFLAENNHEVLRLPPYHPDLNPIEMAWTAVKWYVDTKNSTWGVEGTTDLMKQKIESLGLREWNLLCQKVKEVEEQYRRSDHIVDMLTEKFIVQVDDDDSGSDDTRSVSGDDVSDDDDDEEIIMPASSVGSNYNGDDLVKAFPFPLDD